MKWEIASKEQTFVSLLLLLTKLSGEKVYGCHIHTFVQFGFHRNTESCAVSYFSVT